MRWVRVAQLLRAIRASYWFIPTLMMLGAVLLSLATETLDTRISAPWLERLGPLGDNRPEGARAVLSTIASSMITVAGVTFSTTMVSVSFAAGQFGPRLIGNFMRDRGNQATLGVFIATFVYCLMVLRSVRSESASVAHDAAFVPHVSLVVAMALALACVGVLIYFIHHVPETINVGRITAQVGRALDRDLRSLFPEIDDEVGAAASGDREGLDWHGAQDVPSQRRGYLEAVDLDALCLHAVEHDVVVRLQYRPGDFAHRGDVLMQVLADAPLDDATKATLAGCVAFGRERTAAQNVLFLSDQLIEILARALSPGTNDPYTAVNCINWLGSALIGAADRRPAASHRHDDEGRLRVVAYPLSFERFAASVYGSALQYVATDRNAALALLTVTAEAAVRAGTERRRGVFVEHARQVAAAAGERLPLEADRREVARRLEVIEQLAVDPALRVALRDDQGWFGGTA